MSLRCLFLALVLPLASACGTPAEIQSVGSIGAKAAASAHQEARRYVEAINTEISVETAWLRERMLEHAEFLEIANQLPDPAGYDEIRSGGEQLIAKSNARAARRDKIKKKYATLVPDFPSLDAAKYLELQRAFSALAADLTVAERFKLVTRFYQQTKSEVEKLKSDSSTQGEQ